MVKRFEKLERFFGNSRKKARGPETKESFTFPSPTFMRPTSTHMAPREEQVPFSRQVKEQRSHSLPHQQGSSQTRSSADSTANRPNSRRYSNVPMPTVSAVMGPGQEASHIPKRAHYKSPMGSVLKDEFRTNYAQGASGQEAVQEKTAKGLQDGGFLDWRPRHISSLFHALDLETSIRSHQSTSQDDTAESLTLVPSLPSSSPISPATKIGSAIVSKQSSPKSDEISTRKLALFPRQYPLSPIVTPHVDSPPPSDSEEECRRAVIDRSKALIALTSRISLTPQSSFESRSRRQSKELRHKQSFRETWGNRPGDPNGVGSAMEVCNNVLRSSLIRKSASMTTLSTVIGHVSISRDLKEPTLEEFWALTDDDVAEALDTHEQDPISPPTPPPKDLPKVTIPQNSIRNLSAKPFAPTAAINPSSGELTPPCTPTNSQFLTLAYSPSTPSTALGAMWAAGIARTYKFDLVYVVSLWPSDEGSCVDSSRRSNFRNRQHRRPISENTESGYDFVANPNSKMIGRLLAAYGLSEFPSPFEIHTKFHVNMLRFRGWKEYRDEDATPRTISRGWACSFYSDYIPTSRTSVGTEYSTQGDVMNRGIVFAAYTRKAGSSTIPLDPSPNQEAILEKLYYDAKAFVNALVHGA
ncbi:hypothetical protein F4779DRAFT_438203 [Xylariaceae sp. FL0662B]|nr:hypothetical protein F4779DRAFT_438203 [Xylariaceae sp. FL0662B]